MVSRSIIAVAASVSFAIVGYSSANQDKTKPANRLAKEQSPYLLMHAHNPVDWFPWCPEAFEKAKKENKLVFLSIGYSSCYWCHVMERESFSNSDVAKMLNQSFVCIKVDREERPDVDQVYMTALMLIRGGTGGWPMSMFLTPEGKPIIGGTYWPREDRIINDEKSPGFVTVCKKVLEIYKEAPKEALAQAERIAEATAMELDAPLKEAEQVELNRKVISDAIEKLSETFDSVYGGFGSPQTNFRGTKFPLPSRLLFLLHQNARSKTAELMSILTPTLDNMARGGIYDHLGGGFHRYSTERTWTVPHFEKMLYDNAQLVEVYARAYAATKNPDYKRVVQETLAYVEREMMSPVGAFYSSQDAETNHEEGRFYVWTQQELMDILPNDDLEFLRRVYMGKKPNFEENYHILRLAKSLAEVATAEKMTLVELETRLAPIKKKLFEARSKRDKPLLNKIALTAWSGQMIAGYAAAGKELSEPAYIQAAVRAAEFVLKHQRTKDGRLLRTYGASPSQAAKAGGHGYLEDYALLAYGLLSLHDATGDKRWLEEARSLTDVMITYHGDAKRGGFYFTAHDHEKLFARHKDQYDGTQPSGNSVALLNLVRLGKLTGEKKYRAEAERGLKTFMPAIQKNATGLTMMLVALEEYLAGESKADNTQKDAPKLDGTWIATSWRRGDAEIGKDQVDTQLVITKDRYEFPVGINRVSAKGALKIDEAKHTIDFTPEDGPAKGKTLLGIYKIEGKVLTLCFTGTGGMRPMEFKSADRNIVLAVYERK